MKASISVLGALLNLEEENEKAALTQFASADLQAALQALPTHFHGNPTKGMTPFEKLLERVHESWIAPLLRERNEDEVRLFLSIFSKELQGKLSALLGVRMKEVHLKKLAKHYLQTTLATEIFQGDLLPPECLPEGPMTHLYEMSERELQLMIDFLGLHDLAGEMRELIDAAQLRRLYGALSEVELTFVKARLFEPERVLFKRMQLKEWKGNAEELRHLLHRRGINRLAKALHGEEPSLLFYVSRTLEREDGLLLEKSATALEHRRAYEVLRHEVTQLLTLWKDKRAPFAA